MKFVVACKAKFLSYFGFGICKLVFWSRYWMMHYSFIHEWRDALTLYRFNSGVAKHYFCSKWQIYTTTSAAPI